MVVEAAEHGDGRRSRRDIVLAVAVPIVAAAVALVGVVRYHERDQSSWRGASFGMFATYEAHRSRFVRVTVHRDGIDTLVALPDDLERLRERAAVTPRDGAAEALARAVSERVDADEVTVQVLGHVARAEDGRVHVRTRLIHEVRVP